MQRLWSALDSEDEGDWEAPHDLVLSSLQYHFSGECTDTPNPDRLLAPCAFQYCARVAARNLGFRWQTIRYLNSYNDILQAVDGVGAHHSVSQAAQHTTPQQQLAAILVSLPVDVLEYMSFHVSSMPIHRT